MRAQWALMALPLIPINVAAQAVGILTGTVQAADGSPVALARISVVGSREAALTNLSGAFRLSLPPGSFVVHIRAIGYDIAFVAVSIQAGETATLQATLTPVAVVLRPVQVVGAQPSRIGLQGFELRRNRHEGHFLDSAQIKRMQSRAFTDVLRRIPGVQVMPVRTTYGSSETVRMSRMNGVSGFRPCPVLYFLNGYLMPVTGDVTIDEYVSVSEVVALEVYTGVSQIPPEFNATQHNSRCGVIVIWTAIGSFIPDEP